VVEQNPVWNNITVHPTWENENIIVQRREEGFLSLFFPSLLAETRKMETH